MGNIMIYKEFIKQITELNTNNNQRERRNDYADLCLELYKSYGLKKISESEVVDISEKLLNVNPDPEDRILYELDCTIRDLALDPTYFYKNDFEYLKELVAKIIIGVRHAQAPGLVCYYEKLSNKAVVGTSSVTIYNDGDVIHVLDGNSTVIEAIKKQLDGKKYSLQEAKKKLPKSIDEFMFAGSEHKILSFGLERL